MSLPIVVTVNKGEDWDTCWEQVEGLRKGAIALSLTNYDATTVPQIASGSWIETVGVVHKATSNQTITGSLTSNAINYVTMVPSGAGVSAILTPTWSDSAPTWSDAYQGYYSGTTRYASGCYYDGTNYKLKWVYTNQHAGPKTRYYAVPLVGWTEETTYRLNGNRVGIVNATIGHTFWLGVSLPDNAIVTELKGWAIDFSGSEDYDVDLRWSGLDVTTTTEMALLTFTNGVTEIADTSITDPIIDNSTRKYFIEANNEVAITTNAVFEGFRIKYTEIVRC